MGYTHCWNWRRFTEVDAAGYMRALPTLRGIVKRHRALLAYEYDQQERPPLVGRRGIHLNGRGRDGHETFFFRVPVIKNGVPADQFTPVDRFHRFGDFTKTVYKPYDLAVSELLLVLQAHLPNLEIGSDGFSASLAEAEANPLMALDGTWAQAIANVQAYGITVDVAIHERRPPYCDLLVVPTLTA